MRPPPRSDRCLRLPLREIPGAAREGGFTLVEAIVVIVITGIVAAVVAVFVANPVQGYLDTARRAELTDIADTALRRIARDLRTAVPNSVRQPADGSTLCIEFLPTSTGGRYRAEGPGDILDFTGVTDVAPGPAGFDVIGTAVAVNAGDQIVIYNLGSGNADAYQGSNRRAVSGSGTLANIPFTPTAQAFPLDSPGRRFHVVPAAELAVFYVCVAPGTTAGGDGTGTLFRMSGYGINAAQPATCPAPPAGTPLLASRISQCNFAYAPGVTERSGLVSMTLQLTERNETVSLYQATHVSNLP